MNPVIFISLLNTMLWLVLAYCISRKRKDSFHIANIFIFLFIITYPLKLILTEFGYSVIDSSLYGADWQLYGLFIANISAACFVYGALKWSKVSFKNISVKKDSQKKTEWRWFIYFLILLVFAYGIQPFRNLLSQSQIYDFMQDRADHRTNRAFSALCTQGYLVCLIVFLQSYIYSKKRHLSIMLQLTIWTILSYVLISVSGSKYTALLPITSYILLANMKRVRELRPVSFIKTLLNGMLGVILMMLFSYIRGFGSFQDYSYKERVDTAFKQFTYAFDGPDNLTVILYRISDFWFGDLNFLPTIQNVFISPIPRFIWADKPHVLSNLYIMKDYLYERYTGHLGEVISPSMAGEMLLSGGFIYMTLGSVLFGLLFGKIYKIAIEKPKSYLSNAFYIYLALNVYNLLRSGDGVVSSAIIFFCVATFIIIADKACHKQKLKRSATATTNLATVAERYAPQAHSILK